MRGGRGKTVGVCIGSLRIIDLGFVKGFVTLFSIHTCRSQGKRILGCPRMGVW